MQAEELFHLYDSCWFQLEIFKKNPISSNSSSKPDHPIQEESSKLEISGFPTIPHCCRGMSDQLNSMPSFKLDSLSSDSFNLTPKLQTIPSEKEVTEALNLSRNHPELFLPKLKNTNRLKKRRETKSLSELEFEELKGFMDLGFVFSEEHKDSNLASIVPGLNRLGNRDEKEEEGNFDESAIPRPYLSEAWEFLERKEKEKPLMNWKVPDMSNEIIMKNNLKWWAHAVASSFK